MIFLNFNLNFLRKIILLGSLGSVASLGFVSFAEAGNFSDDVHPYTLSNGLKLLVRVDARAPVVMSEVWYQGGASEERLGETGVSHFLEHMMSKGSTNFPPNELKQLIATNGGLSNGYAFHDATMYSDFMPKDQLPLIFQLESNRMENLNFTPEEFQTEQKIILEERRLEIDDDPMGYVFQTLNYVSNIASPYANPIIGWESDIQQLSIDDLENWYEKYYIANLTTLVVVGDVDPQNVYNLAEQYFGNLKTGLPLGNKNYPILTQTGVKHVLVKRPGGVSILMMSFRVPSIASTQAQSEGFDLLVLADLLVQMQSSRLQEDLVRTQGLASYIGVSYNPLARYNTNFTFIARPMPGVSLAQIETAIFNELEGLMIKPPTAEELNRVKKYAQSQHLYNLDSLSGQASLLGRLETVNLPWQLSSDYLMNIDAVTDSDLLAVVQKYFSQDNLVDAERVPVSFKSSQSTKQANSSLLIKTAMNNGMDGVYEKGDLA